MKRPEEVSLFPNDNSVYRIIHLEICGISRKRIAHPALYLDKFQSFERRNAIRYCRFFRYPITIRNNNIDSSVVIFSNSDFIAVSCDGISYDGIVR